MDSSLSATVSRSISRVHQAYDMVERHSMAVE